MKIPQRSEKKPPPSNLSDDKKRSSQYVIPFSMGDLVLRLTELLGSRFDQHTKNLDYRTLNQKRKNDLIQLFNSSK